jgi:hypothetical protein
MASLACSSASTAASRVTVRKSSRVSKSGTKRGIRTQVYPVGPRVLRVKDFRNLSGRLTHRTVPANTIVRPRRKSSGLCKKILVVVPGTTAEIFTNVGRFPQANPVTFDLAPGKNALHNCPSKGSKFRGSKKGRSGPKSGAQVLCFLNFDL